MSKQIFNGKTLYTKTCVDNILRIFNTQIEVDEPLENWYTEAHIFAEYLSITYKVDLLKVCGIIAALSPMKNWKENKRIAESFLSTGNAFHTKAFTKKAKDILNGETEQTFISDILKGNKITSFFLNIAFPNNSNIVTIDRHAQDIAVNKTIIEDKRNMTVKQYEFFVNCYVIAANKAGVRPSQMQSVT